MGFCHRFIKKYASIAYALTESFTWNFDAQHAFDSLKIAMTEAPVLG